MTISQGAEFDLIQFGIGGETMEYGGGEGWVGLTRLIEDVEGGRVGDGVC